jgi:hypothetical protein
VKTLKNSWKKMPPNVMVLVLVYWIEILHVLPTVYAKVIKGILM